MYCLNKQQQQKKEKCFPRLKMGIQMIYQKIPSAPEMYAVVKNSIQIEIAQFSKAKINISQGKSQKLKLMCCNFLRTE